MSMYLWCAPNICVISLTHENKSCFDLVYIAVTAINFKSNSCFVPSRNLNLFFNIIWLAVDFRDSVCLRNYLMIRMEKERVSLMPPREEVWQMGRGLRT